MANGEKPGEWDIRVSDEPGNRATVALVYRAVDDLRRITEGNFETMRVQLHQFSALPEKVEYLTREMGALGVRIEAMEELNGGAKTNALSVELLELRAELRLRDERVAVARATLAEETERRRAELSGAQESKDRTFTKRERTLGLAFGFVWLIMTILIVTHSLN